MSDTWGWGATYAEMNAPFTGPVEYGASSSAAEQLGDAFARLVDLLTYYNLHSLVPWVKEMIVNGATETEIVQGLRDRPVFRARFKAIFEREKLGLPAISPAEVLAYERGVMALMRSAGMPPGFYDSPDDFVTLLVADRSLAEVRDDIVGGYVRVASVSPLIRSKFQEYFGPDGDAALAAWFVDADKAAPLLQRAVAMAEIGGAGLNLGFNIGAGNAERIFGAGVDASGARTGFGNLAEIRGVFEETITESEDLVAEQQGVEAVFGLDAESRSKVSRRQEERAAAFRGGGGAAASSRGVSGLGAAK